MNAGKVCKTCKFCVPVTDESGYCHRLPPAYIPMSLSYPTPASAWPPVSLKEGWCGEFLPR
jgi:hypothetical protein